MYFGSLWTAAALEHPAKATFCHKMTGGRGFFWENYYRVVGELNQGKSKM